MSNETQAPATPAPEAAPTPPAVESPPKVKVVERSANHSQDKLRQLAAQVAKHGSRRLLWEYLRLRTRVLAR